MVLRSRIKKVRQNKRRRCPKCNKLLRIHVRRCKTCHLLQPRP